VTSVVQMIAGLVLVLGAIAGAAVLARRFGFAPGAASSLVKIVGAQAVGPKERVVVVDIEGRRYILGVAPGRVTALNIVQKEISQ